MKLFLKKDGEDVPKLEFIEVILVHCNLVTNNYQQAFINNIKYKNHRIFIH